MRLAYEARYGKLENHEVPGKAYLGLKLEQVELNEPRPESLCEVAPHEGGEEDFLVSEITSRGADSAVCIRKGSRDRKLPADSEDLRLRLKLVGNCWLFLKLAPGL
eukprot:2054980-Amphidinium_carterae.2